MEKVPRATNRVHTLTSVDHHHSTTWVEAEREGEGLATGPRVVKVSHARRRPATVIARRGCGSAGLRNLRRRLVVVVAPDATAVVHRHPVAPRRPPLWPWLGRTGAHGAAAPAQGAPRATGERGGRHQHLLQEGAVRFRAHVKLHFVAKEWGRSMGDCSTVAGEYNANGASPYMLLPPPLLPVRPPPLRPPPWPPPPRPRFPFDSPTSLPPQSLLSSALHPLPLRPPPPPPPPKPTPHLPFQRHTPLSLRE